jgi:tRNA threonylcarbamoyladenosine modification (KEOPS) complex  Pcc1 subunit
MSEAVPPWTATVTLRLPDPALAEWVERALRPEAAREVPRAHAELRTTGKGVVELTIAARDTGAMRAAINTYLGWLHLSLATLAVSGAASDPAESGA